MAAVPPLVALQAAALRFGERPLFEDLSLGLAPGERACVVGRNGSGKSSLLKALAGEIQPDAGERFLQPGAKVAYLPQDPVLPPEQTVADYVAAGLPHAEGSAEAYRIDAVLDHLELDGNRLLGKLSGGEGRRAALARALVCEPDVLLLDEPTNHLDLPTITWLEEELGRFRGAILLVSHDRAFLAAVSRVTYWLDRGQLRRLDKSFAHFEAWADELLQREAEAQHRLDRRIVREEKWLQRGVTARRKRNQGRLARLRTLRQERAEWLRPAAGPEMAVTSASASGQRVIEAEHVTKSFVDASGNKRRIVRDFSTRIRRGDRIGIIGRNGAGKTTLVRLLTGALAPDTGKVALGVNVEPLYFDQKRESLDPEATLWQTLVPGGGDSLMVRGRQRHVVSYLTDFLFAESQARQPVKSLSGGEKNRLLLARLFARPSNLLVLDEPTNDLDMETLDLLLEVLDGYDGTLLLVSHDRDFLDRLVTGIFAVEGDGRVADTVGGYGDYLAQRPAPPAPAPTGKPAPAKPKAKTTDAPPRRAAKLSYKDARELERLPAEIERLNGAIAGLEGRLAQPDLYQRDRAGFEHATAELAETRRALAAAEERWLELEERRERLAAGESDDNHGPPARGLA
ncbi:MAG: ABC-F family ATP-binding cassette domain-containing protein [Kiloniellales bacterium]